MTMLVSASVVSDLMAVVAPLAAGWKVALVARKFVSSMDLVRSCGDSLPDTFLSRVSPVVFTVGNVFRGWCCLCGAGSNQCSYLGRSDAFLAKWWRFRWTFR